MDGYKERVIMEKSALDEKIGKLEGFVRTSTFGAMHSDDAFLLRQQLITMRTYSGILEDRIARF